MPQITLSTGKVVEERSSAHHTLNYLLSEGEFSAFWSYIVAIISIAYQSILQSFYGTAEDEEDTAAALHAQKEKDATDTDTDLMLSDYSDTEMETMRASTPSSSGISTPAPTNLEQNIPRPASDRHLDLRFGPMKINKAEKGLDKNASIPFDGQTPENYKLTFRIASPNIVVLEIITFPELKLKSFVRMGKHQTFKKLKTKMRKEPASLYCGRWEHPNTFSLAWNHPGQKHEKERLTPIFDNDTPASIGMDQGVHKMMWGPFSNIPAMLDMTMDD
ncbi:hypothetical protein D6C84_06702 [Aureobasidium pullulans]|uniref:Uncharacterized protein n=1 Tax=Aureobasidium pullulans TaxID=5580 RepID=A0A4S9XN80_AURPU|nr:hypothetical protein D6C84_06702 [Aureobasidium pullulans]